MADSTDTRVCPACGTELPGDAAFCHSCGTQQPETVAQTPEEIAAQEAELEAALRAALEPQYQLIRRLGRGGMGSVYLARDPELKRSVAVKVLAPELAADETARTRFQREAQAVAALSHPNVVAIHSVGVLETGAPYFVMQHVEGGNLEERLQEEGPLEVAEAKRVLGQVASALEAAHAKGIIHRDVKPSNVLHDPESDRVLVSDFGIAAVRPGSAMTGPTQLTQTGALVGTPRYMSPEQLLGEAVTEKTDIYGLGLLAYELLTGQSPFEGQSPQMIAAAHLKDAPPELGEAREDADPELREVVRACLAKEADERPTAGELARRLHPGAGGLLEWPPPGLEGLKGRLRRPTLFLLVGSAAYVLPSLVVVNRGAVVTMGGSSLAQNVGLAVALGGLVLLGVGLLQLSRLMGAVRRAVRLGHAWGIITEVLADVRGDTGAVIAGAREYAVLSPTERGSVRRGRVANSLSLVLAATLPIPGFLVMSRLAAAGVLGAEWAWTVPVLPMVALTLLALGLQWREARRVKQDRRSMRRRSGAEQSARKIIPSWYVRLAETNAGQPGPGPAGRPALTWAVVAGLAVLVGGGALVALPVTAVTTSGGAFLQMTIPRFGTTQNMVREIEHGRRYRLTPDPELSPVEAGALLARISPPRVDPGDRAYPALRIPMDTLSGAGYPAVCDTVFDRGLARLVGDAFARAADGFNPREMRCIRAIETHPGQALLLRLGRAPGLDYWGPILETPLPPTLAPHDLPLPRYSTLRSVAYAVVLRAAAASAEGRAAEAELVLRSILSLGYVMVDDGHFLITTLIGAVFAGMALDGLEAHYRLTGRTDTARRLAAARDSAEAVTEALELQEERTSPWRSSDPTTLRALVLSTVADSSALPSLRWEMLNIMVGFPCTNTRELLFGPEPELQQAWQRARADLVRTPSEETLFQLHRETLQRLARREVGHVGVRGVRVVGQLLGSEQLQGCATILDV